MGPGGGMGWMWLWWLLIFVGAAALTVGLVRTWRPRSGSRDDTSPATSTARQILDERLARGEITEEEYRDRRKALDG